MNRVYPISPLTVPIDSFDGNLGIAVVPRRGGGNKVNCCCCISLKTGAKILATFHILKDLVFIPLIFYSGLTDFYEVVESPPSDEMLAITTLVYSALIVWMMVDLSVAVFLHRGASTGDISKVRASLRFGMIMIFILFADFVYVILVSDANGNGFLLIAGGDLGLIFLYGVTSIVAKDLVVEFRKGGGVQNDAENGSQLDVDAAQLQQRLRAERSNLTAALYNPPLKNGQRQTPFPVSY